MAYLRRLNRNFIQIKLLLFIALSAALAIVMAHEAYAGKFLPNGDYVDGTDSGSSNFMPHRYRSGSSFRASRRGNNINASQYNSTSRVKTRLTIPQGGVLISSFTTSGNDEQYVGFGFTTPVGVSPASVNVWLSDRAGGDSLGLRCRLDNKGYTYLLRATTYLDHYCKIQPNTKYFLHIEHVLPSQPDSQIYRELTTSFGS